MYLTSLSPLLSGETCCPCDGADDGSAAVTSTGKARQDLWERQVARLSRLL